MIKLSTAFVALALTTASSVATSLEAPDMRGEEATNSFSARLHQPVDRDQQTPESSALGAMESVAGRAKASESESPEQKRIRAKDNFAFPSIDTYDHSRTRVFDSDPATRSVVDFRLQNRHGMGYRALSMMSRSHFSVDSASSVLSMQEAARFGAFLERAPSDAPAVMVYYPAGRALSDAQTRHAVEQSLTALAQNTRSDLEVEVDVAGAWPRWVSGEQGDLGRLEVLYSAF